jgi:hypothetical protein
MHYCHTHTQFIQSSNALKHREKQESHDFELPRIVE